MTDEQSTDSTGTDDGIDTDTGDGQTRGGVDSKTRKSRTAKILEYLEVGTLAVLALLGVIAVFGAYTASLEAIDVWVADEYRPIYRAVFNLVVLGFVSIGISVLVRRRFSD